MGYKESIKVVLKRLPFAIMPISVKRFQSLKKSQKKAYWLEKRLERLKIDLAGAKEKIHNNTLISGVTKHGMNLHESIVNQMREVDDEDERLLARSMEISLALIRFNLTKDIGFICLGILLSKLALHGVACSFFAEADKDMAKSLAPSEYSRSLIDLGRVQGLAVLEIYLAENHSAISAELRVALLNVKAMSSDSRFSEGQ